MEIFLNLGFYRFLSQRNVDQFNSFAKRYLSNPVLDDTVTGLPQIWKTWKNISFWQKLGKTWKSQGKDLQNRVRLGKVKEIFMWNK